MSQKSHQCDLSGTVWYEDQGILVGCTQAGKKRKERNDCMVIALAAVVNIPYELSYQLLRKFGYIRGKGVDWYRVLRGGPFKWRAYVRKAITVRKFSVTHPEGKYLCLLRIRDAKRCHVVAMVNGVVLNAGIDSMDSRIYLAWRYEGLKKHV